MRSSIAWLNDVPLDASATVTWAETVGIEPYVAPVTADRKFLDKLSFAEPLTLTIKAGGRTGVYESLFLMGEVGTVDRNRKTVLLADQRIWWKRIHLFRRYNIRTRSGSRRREDADGEIPLEVAQVADDVTFKPFSLRDGSIPWKPDLVVEDLLRELTQRTPGGSFFNLGETGGIPNRRLIDNLEIDDSGDNALGIALAHLPGLMPTVTREGGVYLVNTLDYESARRVVEEEAGEEVFFAGHPIFADLKPIRPKSVRVLFAREQELRVDCVDTNDTVSADEPFAQNVAPIPDPSLVVNGEALTQGTYVTFAELLSGWAADMGGLDLPPITDTIIRENWVISYLSRLYGQLGILSPDVDWVRRIATIYTHYRQTWRINRRYMDAIYSLRPYRVSLLDPETGTFAASAVYADWSVLYSEKGLINQEDSLHVAQSIAGGIGPTTPLADGEVAPCRLVVVDAEQGIVRFAFATDLYGHVKQIVPSQLDNVPTLQPDDWASEGYFADGTDSGDGVALDLSAEYRAAFVVTVAPGSPNSTKQLHAIEIGSDDEGLADYLPATVGPVEGTGPDWDLRVGAQIAAARFAWRHTNRDDILRSIGVEGDYEPLSEEVAADLLTNPDELRELAYASVAGLLSGMADHLIGQKVVGFNPDIRVEGSINAIQHTVAPNGTVLTRISMQEQARPIDFLAMLPPSARRVFLREVQP